MPICAECVKDLAEKSTATELLDKLSGSYLAKTRKLEALVEAVERCENMFDKPISTTEKGKQRLKLIIEKEFDELKQLLDAKKEQIMQSVENYENAQQKEIESFKQKFSDIKKELEDRSSIGQSADYIKLVKDYQEDLPIDELLSIYRGVMSKNIMSNMKLQIQSTLEKIKESVSKDFICFRLKDLSPTPSEFDEKKRLEVQLQKTRSMFEMINLKQYINYQLSKSEDGTQIRISLGERPDVEDCFHNPEQLVALATGYLEQQRIPYEILYNQIEVGENGNGIRDIESYSKESSVPNRAPGKKKTYLVSSVRVKWCMYGHASYKRPQKQNPKDHFDLKSLPVTKKSSDF